MAEPAGAFELFYSYAHKDEKLRNELEKHLVHLKRLGLIIEWYDRDISAGTEWAYEIDTHLNTANIILLLISPDFIASEYCYSIEMTRAMERHEAGDARVIPIILRPSEWKSSPFSKLQALPTNGRPVTKWSNRDEALLIVAKGIQEAIKKLPPPSPTILELSPDQKQAEITSSPGSISQSLVLDELQMQDANRAPAWNVPYRRNPLFTSREDILQQLHETFTRPAERSSNQPLVLSGLGGMGKTQIAIEYAYRYREEYPDHDVLWTKADSQEVLTSELASFATLLNLPGQREQDQQYALSTVKRWLEVHSDWMLILDNIENLTMVNEYLPDEPKGHILLTAQTRIIGRIAQRLDIDKMAPEDGALFLLRRANLITAKAPLESVFEDTRKDAIDITKILDGLPLAIDQAGAYITETETSLRHYIELYARRRTDLLNERGELVSDHPQSVWTTLSLSFEKVELSNAASAELLRFLAFLHPDAIPDKLIERSASQLGSLLEAVASDSLSLDKAIVELLKYSLVRRNPGDATLTIHRLVQAVLKDGMDDPTQSRWAERVVRSVNQAFPQVEFANWQACQLYLPQTQICVTLITTYHFTFPEAAQLLQKTGEYLHQRGQYTEAVTLITQALAIREQTLGAEHLDIAESLNELAELHREQGMYSEAVPLYERALSIREHILGPEHPDVATSLNNLARPYHHQARYTEAEPLYQRALAIREQALGPIHPDVAHSLNDLSSLYHEQGRYTEAELLLQRALAIREQVLGPSHPDTATSLSNLASLYGMQGRYTEAEPLYLRALAIREQVLGPSHPDTATSLSNLASLYHDQGRYIKAEPLHQRALAIYEQVLGPSHPDTATSLSNLASLYGMQGRYTEAEPLHQRALAIREQALGPTHPDTAGSLNNLASLYHDQGRYTEAEPLYLRALAIYEQALGPSHPDTAKSLSNLASLYHDQGRYIKAEPLYLRALAIREQALGPTHPGTANSLNNLASLYINKHNYGRAEPLLKRALAICEQVLGPNHPNTVKVLQNYISLFRATNRQGRAKEMEAQLKRAQSSEYQ